MRQRWSKLSAALSVAVLSLVFGGPAHASPEPEDKKTYQIIPYIISDPELIEHPERVSAEFKKNLNLDNLGISPATADSPSVTAASRAVLAEEPVSYLVDSARFPNGTRPGDVYDYPTYLDCRGNGRSWTDAGWIKNRYSYCQVHMVYMPAVECGLIPPFCETVGEFEAINTTMGQGMLGGATPERNATINLHVEVTKATGPWEDEDSTMTAIIKCSGGYRNPIVAVDEDRACYSRDSGRREQSIEDWRHDSEVPFHLVSDALPPAAENGEQIATGVFRIRYEFHIPWYIQFKEASSPEGGMRFDSAWYLNVANNERNGSVFDRAVPGIALDKDEPAIRGAAVHIEEAQKTPGATVPKNPDKAVPGATPGNPLHRLAGAMSDDRRKRANRNRTVSTSYCRQNADMPAQPADPPNTNWECDEYPMASTYEGSAASETEWATADAAAGRPVQQPLNWSVKWVSDKENGEAGGRVGRWMEVDRLLDYDRMFVKIVGEGDFPLPDDEELWVSAGPDRTGQEGVPVGLLGFVRGASGTPAAQWSYTAGPDVDAGATCTFADAADPTTTIKCTDDGTFTVTLTGSDGVHGQDSESATVTLSNVDPAFRDIALPNIADAKVVSPTKWPVYRADREVEIRIPFTDPGSNDTHTCFVDWDDHEGYTAGIPAEGNACVFDHVFPHAGMFTLRVLVRDDEGGDDTTETMVVVYDPDAGTANIDGSFKTASGALVSDPNAAGQTWLHNTAQYQSSDATRPVGEGKAWVDGTGFRLEPNGMEWFVLTPDKRVASRGTGTLNGRSGYTWLMYGVPGGSQSGKDQVRLVVFETGSGTVVYDSDPLSIYYDVDVLYPMSELTSGAVQVHPK